MFELAFDYGPPSTGEPDLIGAWIPRSDPFSSYRAGFEVRTYRLCRRVLMFHDFPDDADVGAHRLVRSLELAYRTTPDAAAASDPGYSFLAAATQWSHQRHAGEWHRRQLPPIEFVYSEATIDDQVREVDAQVLENLPVGLGDGYQWLDLDGEGLSGILTEQGGAWFYKPNLGSGPSGPRFGPMRPVGAPAMAALGGGRQQLLDVQGDGALDLVDLPRRRWRVPCARRRRRLEARSSRSRACRTSTGNDPNLRFVDLTGDGSRTR